MKSLKRTLAMLTAAALAAVASAGTQTWDFSDGLDEWRFVTYHLWGAGKSRPIWITENGTLQQSNKHAWAVAVVGEDYWDNYAVSARIRIDEPFNAQPIGLVFRARFLPDNEFVCYAFEINLIHQKVALARYRRYRGLRISYRYPNEEGAAVEFGKWYDIRAHVNGGHFQCYINDALEFEYTDEDYIAQGAVGIVSLYSIVSMDDLTVTGGSIEGGILTEQWARLKLREKERL
ncbi:MAG: hypothetical protein OXT69_04160 [Candidatus Poribacteria bacterium]|nr:hypothetical protein [Candidatus Poribacteria bacterium]